MTRPDQPGRHPSLANPPRAQAQPPARVPVAAPEARSGAGGLWLLLLPVVCCGGPFLIGALATAGALAWGGMGLGAAVIAAVVIGVLRRRRRACCEPRAGAEGLARQAGGAWPPR